MHPFEHVASLLIWQLKADFSPSRTLRTYIGAMCSYIYILIIYNLLLHDICLSHFISIFPILCGELRFLWTELPNHMTFLLLSVWLDFSGAVGIKRKTWLCALISPPINKHQDYLFFHVHVPFLLDEILILVCISWHLEDRQSTFFDDMKINHDAATMRSINLELSVVLGGWFARFRILCGKANDKPSPNSP